MSTLALRILSSTNTIVNQQENMARSLPCNRSQMQNLYRTTFLVFNYKNLSDKIRSFQQEVLQYKTKEISDRQTFLCQWSIDDLESDACGSDAITTIAYALTFWAKNGSFNLCRKCNSVIPVNMPYNF